MRLQDKVSIITGAGTGIGRAAARLFAREGARVVVAEVARTTGQETVDLIRGEGGEAIFVPTDVSRLADCERMVQAALESYGKLDVLYNNAGIYRMGTVVDTSEETWDQVMAINLKGTFLCAKVAVPHMIANGGGSIINTSSGVGWNVAGPNAVAYSASKSGVTMLTRVMALDHARDKIRVNCLVPGPIDTPLMHAAFSEDHLARVAGNMLFNRLGEPEEIANAALWLASDEASFVTGAVFAVDGGRTAGWAPA